MAGKGNPLVNNKAILAALEAELEVIKAKIASTKAEIQKDKAVVASNNNAESRKLTGERDEDGTLVTAKDQEARLDAQKEAGKIREDEIYKEMYPEEGVVKVPEIPDEESTRERTKEEEEIYQALLEGKELTDEQYEITNQMSREDFEATGIPFVDKKVFTEDADIKGEDADIEGDERNFWLGSSRRGEKPGYKKGDSDYWSVNEKDDYWKTEEGYEEAMNLYGSKPSWLKAEDVGTLVYNPSTGEYEEVEQEEFVDLKPYKKRISL
jgi:hypothetical protein